MLGALAALGTAETRDCPAADAAYNRATELLDSGQRLVAAVHFSMAKAMSCDRASAERAGFGYAVAMLRLGELAESLREARALGDTAEDPQTRRSARVLQGFAVPELRSAIVEDHDRFRLSILSARDDPTRLGKALDSWPGGSTEPLQAIRRQLVSAPQRSSALAAILSGI